MSRPMHRKPKPHIVWCAAESRYRMWNPLPHDGTYDVEHAFSKWRDSVANPTTGEVK